MIRRAARRLLRPIRRFNRWWIDRLDPDWPPAPAPAPPPAQRPAAAPIAVWTEPTPNPNALKFLCSVQVSAAPVTWSRDTAADAPLGRALLAIDGVRTAFAVADFVTIERDPDASWDALEPQVEAAIREALGRT